MPELVVGPLLRYVGEREATIWVETDTAAEIEILGHRASTFCVAGHHYALVVVGGLDPGGSYPYTVAVDGRECWPPPGSPPSLIRTTSPAGPRAIVFGSCRRTAPEEHPWTAPPDAHRLGLGHDALIAYARRLMVAPEAVPDLMLFGGDQVYSDLPSPAALEFIRSRRPVVGDHDAETIDFEEYAFEYREAWSHPALRWLLSTVPTAMIFDDHDVHNGWNADQHWVDEMSAQPGWPQRITAGLVAYSVYQHLGNLSPGELPDDDVWQAVTRGADASAALEALAHRSAGLAPGAAARWSYRRDIGPVRVVVVDSRSARVLPEGRRDMLVEPEWSWVEDNLTGGVEHLVVVTSVPVLLPHMVHHLEAWSDRAGAGAWGRVGRAAARRARNALGLEHWPAFTAAFDRLLAALDEVAAGQRGKAPSSVLILSGEVHYSYVAELAVPGAPVVQIVSSPLRNPPGRLLRAMHRFSTSRAAGWAARALAASARVPRSRWRWRLTSRLHFGNGLASIRFDGGDVRLQRESTAGGGGLSVVDDQRITRPR